MEMVRSVEEGVVKLLKFRKRSVPFFMLEKNNNGFLDTLIWDGNRIPLFDSHFDPQIRAVAQYGNDSGVNCALNGYSFCGRDVSLESLIFREVDIAEFIMHSKVKKVTAFVNGTAANMILVMENGACANMDLGCSMAPGTGNQCQHRLITTHGMANDRGVTDMIPQHQVHVFGMESQNPRWYDDMDVYLYGLNEEDSRKAIAIHAIITGQECWEQWKNNETRCRNVVEAVFKSSEICASVYL